jgi:hypothetical protein
MEAHPLTEMDATNSTLLCLKCRQAGHLVDKCPSAHWLPEFDWFLSPARKGMKSGNGSSRFQQELCKRCRLLDLPRFLHEEIPWKSGPELNEAARDGSEHIRSLGKTGAIEFWSDCPLCRCLFALTPNPSSTMQDVLILPHWSIFRLEGGIWVDTEEKRRFAKCLLIALNPSSVNTKFSDRVHLGDALCIVEEDDSHHAITLGGRKIDPYQLNVAMIEEWLTSCRRLHGVNCNPTWSEKLRDIRLIDVSTRQIVRHPERHCDYLALSYVWGGVVQQSYQLGSILDRQPQTIEDAIAFAQILGKQYLWVDSVCIDQQDPADKIHQIGRMSDVYRGAYVTVIALSGESANAGLPRLVSHARMYSQLDCCIEDKRMVGLMPTLSELIWVSPWGLRAWTLQEALLSPRCLYMSDFQIYFECNAMQCSESLDQTKSWVHQICRHSTPAQEWLEAKVGSGVLRHPLVGGSGIKNNRLIQYGSALILYSQRSMTNPDDALNAFSGILQDLEKQYGSEFFCGLPVPEFQWGLLWRIQPPFKRRLDFPTWSWAGWEGFTGQLFPSNPHKPYEFQPYLFICRAVGGELVQLFRSSQDMGGDTKDLETFFQDDPVTKAALSNSQDPDFDIGQYSENEAEKSRYLFVEAIAFHFIPDYSRPSPNEGEGLERFVIVIRGIACVMKITMTDLEKDRSAEQTKRQFLLLARDRSTAGIRHHLLLLDFVQDNVAVRSTVLELIIPEDHLALLEELEPRKRRVVLS